MRFRIIGPGRAGSSLDQALRNVGWHGEPILGRNDSQADAGANVDVLFLAVPDDAISSVAQSVNACDAVVVHLAGSRTLAELNPHARRASVHPLTSLPNSTIGAATLVDDCSFAVAGDEVASQIVHALGGNAFPVADESRATYHAGAVVAGNHATALWAQVERIARQAGVPASVYWPLMKTSIENAVAANAQAAITGPASRGDWDTVKAHLAAIGPDETKLYKALASEAAKLGGQELPEDLQ